MRAVAVIAANTMRELVRSKLLYNLLLFAALFIGSSLGVAQLTIGNWARVILDMGLAAIELVGTLMAVIIGVGLLAGEVQRRTVLPTLAKPVARWQFCLGRYLGLLLLLAVNVAVMLALLALVLKAANFKLGAPALSAALLIFVELALIAAVAVLFASFSTPLLAGGFALAIFFIGHLLSDLQAFGRGKLAGLGRIAAVFYAVLPDLELLNVKAQAANELPVAAAFVWRSAAYGCAYAAVTLIIAMAIFSRRDLN